MNSQNLPWITTISFISVLKLLVAFEFPQYLGNPDEMLYQSCGGSFSCGSSVTGVDYPFRGTEKPEFCGYPGLVLDCQNDNTTIDINNLTFRVLGIDQARQTMKIAREDVMDSGCPQKLVNTSVDNSLFDYDSNYMNFTFLYGCPGSTIPNVSAVSCKAPDGYGSVFLFPGTLGPQSCDVSVTVPVSGFGGLINSTGTGQAIQGGFEVKWKVDSKACSECTASNGRCGYGIVANRTTCFCPSEPYVSDTCGGSAGAGTPESSRAPGAGDEQYTNCNRTFQCGNLLNIGYPFSGGDRPSYCGHSSFGLTCVSNVPEITIESITYRVLAIDNTSHVLTVARNDYWNTVCPTRYLNASLDTTHFSYGSDSQALMLYYDCPTLSSAITLPNRFNCSINSTSNSTGIFVPSGVTSYGSQSDSCSTSVSVQVNKTKGEALASDLASTLTAINVTQLTQLLDTGFGLQWEANDTNCERCVESGGRCGSNSSSFACYCPDEAYDLTCRNSSMNAGGGNAGLKIALPIAGAVVAGVGLGWIIFSCRQRRKRISAQSALAAQSKDITSPPLSKGLTITPSTNFTRSIPSYPSSNSDFGKSSSYFGVQVFSYTELEEATNNFDPSRQLGEGGFGTVYYGQLQDGRVVAVKRLFENNFRRVEQFMNEVEILTRLRHENLVTLFGCTSRRSRELLLVYEYIPNGTVADHVHGKRSNSGLLSWPVRLSIAIETANALAYLHESDIIHRDVKTNNILLDNDFRVKVADFGLSRLFPTDVTHVSTAPQGTPGYVDPEYYQCYQLTEKSDVYSFGVVLIELISSKQAVDTNRNRHDINLANMAINKIQNHTLHELVDPSLGFETNNLVRRMTTLVAELAFRCLQMERDMRPSMQEVRDALKGIKNEEMNAQQAEVVDIVIEDDVIGLLKGNPEPGMSTSDSTATEKLVSSSTTTPNSSA